VHLDVKPANVLVTAKESANEHVYLADFGLTRRGATGHRTRGGDFLGSPTYAAPEHLRGEPVDGRTDEYSMACVLFACLSGRPPFAGSVPEVISGHLNSEVPSLSAITNLPPAIDEVIRRGMAKDSSRRYPDCRQLIAAARTALMPRPQQPRPNPMTGPNSGQNPVLGPPSGPNPVAYAPRPQFQGPGPQPGMGQPTNDPVRLRPPMPAGASAFSTDSGGGLPRWLVPTLVAVAILVVAGVLIIWFTNA
jgi:serine/threonine-protein kinase